MERIANVIEHLKARNVKPYLSHLILKAHFREDWKENTRVDRDGGNPVMKLRRYRDAKW